MRAAVGMPMLRRPELARRLAAALDFGDLLLVAPAGFGKTLALQETVAFRGGAVAWLRCSEVERDPGRLLAKIVDGLRAAAPGVAGALHDRLDAGIDPVDVRLAVRALTDDLERLVVDRLTIVVDDAEQLAESEDAAGLIQELLAVEAAALRVAVASRRPLPLRAARLRAAGRLTEIGAADLAFSMAECAELVRARWGREPQDGDLEAIWKTTEGWPLGVALAGVSARVPSDTATLDDYFAEELLGPLQPAERSALVDSSVADALDPAMVERLGLPADFLEHVRGRGLPVTGGPNGDSLTYHPLLHEFLRERLERERPSERRRELHARCADALEAEGRGSDAVEHWLDAADAEQAAMAVARHGPALARTAPGSVLGWLDRLPPEERGAPELKVLRARLLLGSGRVDEVVTLLREAIDSFDARGEAETAWTTRAVLGDVYTIIEDSDAAILLASGYESAPGLGAPQVALTAAAGLAASARYREASELFTKATMHPWGAPLSGIARGFHAYFVDLQCGRLDAALGGVRAAVADLQRQDLVERLVYVVLMEAIVLEERGEDAAALAAYERTRQVAADAAVQGLADDVAHRAVAGIHARAGRLLEAEQQLEQASGVGAGWYPGDADFTRATIAAGRGWHDEAARTVEQALAAGAFDTWRPRWRGTAHLVPVLATAGREAWARDLVDEALSVRPSLANCARLLALRGWLRARAGDQPGALADLAEGWHEAGDGAAHLVRREYSRVEDLLWAALERRVLAPAEVITAFEVAEPAGDALVRLTQHPVVEVRRAAIRSAAASGHPNAYRRLKALESDADEDVAKAARAATTVLAKEPPPRLFAVLGAFAVRRGAHMVDDREWGPRRRAAQRLVRFLLACRDRAVPEDQLFRAFWPDASPESARRSLQVTLSSARATLDLPGAQDSLIEAGDRTYRLVLARRDLVDADEFERAAAAALRATGGSARADLLEAAAARWTAEPLAEDRYEDWAASWRERLIDVERRVLAALADARAAAGDLGGAVEAARQAVELDPLDEAAHRRLMTTYARAGRRGHALRQFLACRRALVDQLGIEPAAETAEMQRRILAGETV